ncbi:MAG: hypothetical protein KTR14_10180 [Vampirovibrio sp.]|nr:hypothetical protein [Vampirovibrio sp.]
MQVQSLSAQYKASSSISGAQKPIAFSQSANMPTPALRFGAKDSFSVGLEDSRSRLEKLKDKLDISDLKGWQKGLIYTAGTVLVAGGIFTGGMFYGEPVSAFLENTLDSMSDLVGAGESSDLADTADLVQKGIEDLAPDVSSLENTSAWRYGGNWNPLNWIF